MLIRGTMEPQKGFTQGDLDAFETLFRQFQSEVYRWIVRIVRDPAMAEDLTVETFWRIYRARGRFDPSREFAPWARTIATNVARQYLKQRRPEVPLVREIPEIAVPDRFLQREMSRIVEAAIRKLPSKLQVAAILGLVEEVPYSEIGQALGISVSAVKSRVSRATALLAKNLRRLGVKP